MLIVPISAPNATALQGETHTHARSRVAHFIFRCACFRAVVSRDPARRNYNRFHLTQLHVWWIIRGRLDNPDRNPFHSFSPTSPLYPPTTSPPTKFPSCHTIFSWDSDNHGSSEDLKFRIMVAGLVRQRFFYFLLLLSQNFILNLPDSITMKSQWFAPLWLQSINMYVNGEHR